MTDNKQDTMNTIEQLQGQVSAQARELQALRDGLSNLRSYLHSTKFCCGDPLDGYVNIVDVLERIRQANSDALDAIDARES